MRPIATERVCLYVCLLVTFVKWLNRSRCRLEGRLEWAQGTMFQMGIKIFKERGTFGVCPAQWKAYWVTAVYAAKQCSRLAGVPCDAASRRNFWLLVFFLACRIIVIIEASKLSTGLQLVDFSFFEVFVPTMLSFRMHKFNLLIKATSQITLENQISTQSIRYETMKHVTQRILLISVFIVLALTLGIFGKLGSHYE